MGAQPADVYSPIAENVEAYNQLFAEYTTLHDYFGRGGNDVMHRLKALQRTALRNAPGTDATGPAVEPETHATATASTGAPAGEAAGAAS
jgi:L-ribulokinase